MIELVQAADKNCGYSISKVDLSCLEVESVANPIGLVQYYLQSSGIPAPVYRFTPTVQPPFKCIATLPDGRSVQGQAHRRADAKSNAAKILLEQLKSDQKSECSSRASGSTRCITPSDSHPASILQSFCHSNKLFPPTYEYKESSARGGGVVYKCECSMVSYNLTASETRKSQREARRAAASTMLKMARKVKEGLESPTSP